MENNLPHVTILICNYNYADYVVKAIESAYSQTYSNYRLCVIDDASSDNSVEVIRKALDDPPVETIFIPLTTNLGLSGAKNTGIQQCIDSTDYFLMLDSDDECYPDKITKMVEIASQNSQIGVVYGDYHILNTKTGNIIYEYKKPFDSPMLLKECIVHSQSLVSSQALDATKEEDGVYYDPNVSGPSIGEFIGCCDDYDLWLRIMEQYMMVHIPEPLSLVRVTGKNQSSIENVTTEIWNKNVKYMSEKAQKRRLQRGQHIG